MSQQSNAPTVEAEVDRLKQAVLEAHQRGELSIDGFDALQQLIDKTHHQFNRGGLDRTAALENLHRVEERLQGAL